MNDVQAVAFIGSLMEGCLRLGMREEWEVLMDLISVQYYDAPI